jgi:glycosyltransferase involved in cell wall biosynthesis
MPLELEILIATQDRDDLSFLKEMFPGDYTKYNLLIINQTTENHIIQAEHLPPNIRVFNVYERGLSKSRNLALEKAEKDVLLIADDDVKYREGFAESIIKSHTGTDVPVLIFPISDEKGAALGLRLKNSRILKGRDFKDVFSPQISLKRSVFFQYGVRFDERFGLGARYPDAENFVFLKTLERLKIPVAYAGVEPIAIHPRLNSSYFIEKDENFETRLVILKKYYPVWLLPYFFKLMFFLLRTRRIGFKDIPAKWRILKKVIQTKTD